MEFAPTFVATPTFNPVTNAVDYPVVRPTAKWPIIRGQTAKLRFTKEREEQHYKDAYQGEGKESYQAHEPERKDAYYGNDGGNKDYGREYYGEAQRA
jgi:CRISPR/Cas system CMR subunit Cmr4 (Cas7 group RAMP superfamily)